MKKRRLGNSDLFVSELGLGCMSLGMDEGKSRTIIEVALEEGINYFDTADLYDYGENEQLVGKALKHVRDKVIIATKVGNKWTDKKNGWSWDPSKQYIKEAVKKSLRRLNTDYLDLYQLHGGTIDDPMTETIEAFEELKEEGYIRFYGISSIRPNVIRKYVKKSSISAVMMQYSILDRRAEEEILPLLQKNNISVLSRGSLAKGLLTERLIAKASPNVKENGYLNYCYNELTEILPKLKEALSSERTFTEVALQYNLANPTVASVIAGASSADQVRENARAIKAKPLTVEEVEWIKNNTKANRYEQHR